MMLSDRAHELWDDAAYWRRLVHRYRVQRDRAVGLCADLLDALDGGSNHDVKTLRMRVTEAIDVATDEELSELRLDGADF